jgi:ribosomal protein S18 acetylase RimI-like enzyme
LLRRDGVRTVADRDPILMARVGAVVRMSVYPSESFEDDVQRRVYEYVERTGAATPAELARAIRLEGDRPHSKPARSGTYTETVPPEPAQLRSSIEALKADGHLTEVDGKLRIALSATTTALECGADAVTIRPAREEDRDGVVETMRTVADDGASVVAENVAAKLEREPALVRATEERSRVCFVAVREQEGADPEVVGWLHLDAPELPALRHAAEVTVGVAPPARRQGIGSSLLEYGLEWAADADYRKLSQNVPATNDAAIDFLESNGWRREGVHEDQYRIDGEFVDEVVLSTWP